MNSVMNIEIHDLISRRHSPRSFSNSMIEEEKLAALFEAARWAPSSANEQPWHFVYATKEEPETFQSLLDTLAEGNRIWAKNAPALVAVIAKTFYERNGRAYAHAWYDVGQSVANLALQATALDLVVHQMGGFSADKVRAALNVPEGFEPVIVFAVGYEGDGDELPEHLREREHAPRTRKPLDEIVFNGTFGKRNLHHATTTNLN
jgi:nitroreductase